MLKVDIDRTARILFPLFKNIWIQEQISTDWKNAIILKYPKKGDRAKCRNWRIPYYPLKSDSKPNGKCIRKTVKERTRGFQGGKKKILCRPYKHSSPNIGTEFGVVCNLIFNLCGLRASL
jgi:hypothetical protein